MHQPKISGTRPRRALVLVVDDDHECRDLLAGILEYEGYGVVRADGGAEAIRLLEAGVRPVAMTLDLHMPVVDGHAVLLHVRGSAELEALPVVVVSASARRGDRVLGATAVLSKPFELSALLEAIRGCTPSARGGIAADAG